MCIRDRFYCCAHLPSFRAFGVIRWELIFLFPSLFLFHPVIASSWKKTGRTSAIHHEAGVTNVIPRFPCFGEILSCSKNQPDTLERRNVETVLWGACYEFRTIAGSPHERSEPSPRIVSTVKVRFGASSKVARVFGIRNMMDRILFLHNSRAQCVAPLV